MTSSQQRIQFLRSLFSIAFIERTPCFTILYVKRVTLASLLSFSFSAGGNTQHHGRDCQQSYTCAKVHISNVRVFRVQHNLRHVAAIAAAGINRSPIAHFHPVLSGRLLMRNTAAIGISTANASITVNRELIIHLPHRQPFE